MAWLCLDSDWVGTRQPGDLLIEQVHAVLLGREASGEDPGEPGLDEFLNPVYESMGRAGS